jgi:hypothetical protein
MNQNLCKIKKICANIVRPRKKKIRSSDVPFVVEPGMSGGWIANEKRPRVKRSRRWSIRGRYFVAANL